jgi:hypothetical protein
MTLRPIRSSASRRRAGCGLWAATTWPDQLESGQAAEPVDRGTVSMFGASDEEQVAAVTAALDRDVPDWRG